MEITEFKKIFKFDEGTGEPSVEITFTAPLQVLSEAILDNSVAYQLGRAIINAATDQESTGFTKDASKIVLDTISTEYPALEIIEEEPENYCYTESYNEWLNSVSTRTPEPGANKEVSKSLLEHCSGLSGYMAAPAAIFNGKTLTAESRVYNTLEEFIAGISTVDILYSVFYRENLIVEIKDGEAVNSKSAYYHIRGIFK